MADSPRDPRVDPIPGDVLRDSEGWTYVVTEAQRGMVRGDMRRGRTSEGALFCKLEVFRSIMREAAPVEVLQ